MKKMEEILENHKKGNITEKDAVRMINDCFYSDIGHTVIDTGREERTGYPEAVFCHGKTEKQIVDILAAMNRKKINVIATRLEHDIYKNISSLFPEGKYFADAGILTIENRKIKKRKGGCIAVVCAGTSDICVAEEAAVTAEFYGHEVRRFYDAGIAGIHRLFRVIDKIREANVVITAAGMEGALPGVVAGLVSSPVIAVPVSSGYGASFNGITALLSMLSTCATGVSVVNIGNGFGAAQVASRICMSGAGK